MLFTLRSTKPNVNGSQNIVGAKLVICLGAAATLAPWAFAFWAFLMP